MVSVNQKLKKVALIVFVLLLWVAISFKGTFSEEIINLTTYYPSPEGRYFEIRANQLSVGRNYRNQTLSNGLLLVESRIGIGVSNPDLYLSIDANRPIRIGSSNTLICNSNRVGTIRYNPYTSSFEYCTLNGWRSFSALECHQVSLDIVNRRGFFDGRQINLTNADECNSLREVVYIPPDKSCIQAISELCPIGEDCIIMCNRNFGFMRTDCYFASRISAGEATQLGIDFDYDLHGIGDATPNACRVDDEETNQPLGGVLTIVCCRK